MLTDLAQDLKKPADAELSMFERAGAQVRQFICGLHGHDSLLHFEDGRMSLLCASCGHETPGWELGRNVADEPQAAAQSPMMRMPLDGHRRVA